MSRRDGTIGRSEEKWRVNDGKPQSGPVEIQDRAMRRKTGDGGSMTWGLLGHSDDIVYWRPAFGRGMLAMGCR